MSASALQPHASIRVPTASATSGGPLDVATSGGPPVAHWWSSGCNDIWWTTGCASRLWSEAVRLVAYSLRSNAHVSFPCYFNSWILIWVLFGTQINIHVLGALTHKISSVEVRDRGAKCRRGFYRVFTFDLNFATRNVAYLSDCPVIIAKQACSHVTLNMHSQFSVLCLFCFLFCFCFVLVVFVFICFVLVISISFVCFTSFLEQKNLRFLHAR